jgi:hypothetical protein
MIQLTPFLAFVIPQIVSESVMFGEAGFENKRQEGSFVLSWRAIGRERESSTAMAASSSVNETRRAAHGKGLVQGPSRRRRSRAESQRMTQT